MERDQIKAIVTEVFSKTFDPVFTVRLLDFMKLYRADVVQRHDWFREFGFHAMVDGKERPTFNLIPLEELTINTISNKIYEAQKGKQN